MMVNGIFMKDDGFSGEMRMSICCGYMYSIPKTGPILAHLLEKTSDTQKS